MRLTRNNKCLKHWSSNPWTSRLPARYGDMHSHPITLILDFDGTLTKTSTLPLIYEIGHGLNPSCPSWHLISQAYVDDYSDFLKSSYSKRTTLSQELDWLEQQRTTEYRSIARIEATKVFRGITNEIVRAAAGEAVTDGKTEMRRGWEKLVGKVMEGEGKVGIVSVGWSAEFIRACLSASMNHMRAEGPDGNIDMGLNVEFIDVRANTILGGEEGKMDDSSLILTADDKLRVMTDLVGMGHNDKPRSLVVYVGDSTTDLECLLHAEVGICLSGEADTMTGEQKELKETLDRLGIGCRWIGEMNAVDVKLRSTDRFWWAEDFDEICHSPLFGAREYIKDSEQCLKVQLQRSDKFENLNAQLSRVYSSLTIDLRLV
ncbi:MAG: hypothetical protein Q9172_002490 [Xanthocarpia lactea]